FPSDLGGAIVRLRHNDRAGRRASVDLADVVQRTLDGNLLRRQHLYLDRGEADGDVTIPIMCRVSAFRGRGNRCPIMTRDGVVTRQEPERTVAPVTAEAEDTDGVCLAWS